ncbi:terpenoid synthase [Flagelloscypha sp. PMI_526]|nr:terpenoid synthase [Flagelloscypha sp. PMI_526]
MRQWTVSAGRQVLVQTTPWGRLRCRKTFAALAQKIRHIEDSSPPSSMARVPVPPLHFESAPKRTDPLTLVSNDLRSIQSNLLDLMGSAHPDLREMAELYFMSPSRQLRPIVIILISRAMNGLGQNWSTKRNAMHLENAEELDRPLTQPGVLQSWSPTMPNDKDSFQGLFACRAVLNSLPLPPKRLETPFSRLLPTQARLAQIVEMINIAFILHDGVSHHPSIPGQCEKNTKLSILGGDFLLGRASSALSRLGEAEVVELIASVISNISEGEIMQLSGVAMPKTGPVPIPATLEEAWSAYSKRTYMKTASLIAKGARAAAVLGGSSQRDSWSDAAYFYGRHLGFASQLVEDAFEVENILSQNKYRVPTAPLLFSWAEHPHMKILLERQFSEPGDRDKAKEYLANSSAVLRTKTLARSHTSRAKAMLRHLPVSAETKALEALADIVVERSWS